MSSQHNGKDIEEKARNVNKMSKACEGRWGYFVLFCSFMTYFIVFGVANTFGIFYKELLDHFEEGRGKTSWVASIMVATTFLFGPIASGLSKKYGWRVITIAGSMLASFGFATSSLVPNVTCLYFTAGFCTGAGFGLMYHQAVVCLPSYFDKKLSFANGIAASGSGIGMFVFAPFIQWLLNIMGWKNAMLVVSGVMLSGCVLAVGFRPVKKDDLIEENDAVNLKNTSTEEPHNDLERNTLVENVEPFLEQPSRNEESSIHNSTSKCAAFCHNNSLHIKKDSYILCNKKKPSFCNSLNKSLRAMVDLGQLKNMPFLLFCIASFLNSSGYSVPFVYTKDRVVALAIASEDEASYLLSMMGISNTINRVIFGYLADCTCVSRLWLFNITLILCGVSTALSSLCLDYTSMAVYVVIFGATSGIYSSLSALVLIDLFGLKKLSNAFGIATMFRGIGALCGPPITGWIYDYTGSYVPGFVFSGTVVVLGGILQCFMSCFYKSQHTSHQKDIGQDTACRDEEDTLTGEKS